jgi:hypothetical protein
MSPMDSPVILIIEIACRVNVTRQVHHNRERRETQMRSMMTGEACPEAHQAMRFSASGRSTARFIRRRGVVAIYHCPMRINRVILALSTTGDRGNAS